MSARLRAPAIWAIVLTALLFGSALVPSFTFFSDPTAYLPLHISLEFVSMAISLMVLALAWNLRHIDENSQIIVIGAASLAIVLIDLAHTLSFAGMPVFFTANSTEKTIWFWLCGRLVAAVGLLVVAVMPVRHWRVRAWLPAVGAALAIVALVWWIGLAHLDATPHTFINGHGLTAFKKDSEYLLSTIYAVAAILLLVRARRGRTSGINLAWLACASWVLALAELYFTLYANVTDIFNLLGHVYKAIAYLMVYQALFVAGVRRPYQQLAEEKSLLQSLIDSMPDLITLRDPQGRYVEANRAFRDYVGRSVPQINGLTPQEVIPRSRDARPAGDPLTPQRYEEWIPRPAGGGSMFDTVETPYFGTTGDALGVIQVSRDITQQKRAEERIHHLALYDQLTGLPNRTMLRDQVDAALASSASAPLALAFVDIDDFKTTNDTVGHRVGDRILQETARRLSNLTPAPHSSSRLGGDEFALLLVDTDAEAASTWAKRILDAFSEPFHIDDYELTLTASVGVALSPHDGTDFETLSRGADLAMFHAKQEGHNTYRFISESMQLTSSHRLTVLSAMRKGIENGEFALAYQPQLSLTDERVVAVEALFRWHHPEFGSITTQTLIDMAEHSGLILPIGDWVLHQALTDALSWQRPGQPGVTVAVNLSAVQFLQNDLPLRIGRSLAETGFPPQLLEVEITETVAMRNPDAAVAMLNRLREIGVQLALDDFGTGYSSMSYLKRLPLDTLKIDRSFIEDVDTDAESDAIVRTIVALADALHLHTVAEGVETASQADAVRAAGCEILQGYHFSRPIPQAELLVLLEAAQRQPVRETT